MDAVVNEPLVPLEVDASIWKQVPVVSPLVVVGTREGDGYNLAVKHMAMPVGWDNYFAFACTPRHATYHNARHTGVFTVSFPRPEQVSYAGLAAAARCDRRGTKPGLAALPTTPAGVVDGVLLAGAYLCLECELDRIVDGFGGGSLVAGRIVAAHVHPEARPPGGAADPDVLEQAPLLVYVSPGRYGVLTESYPFPFPVPFAR
jgi:flavin reductase (DIM6/NTAB) family NADH-FMN oxidoreductase RutF